MGRTNTFSWTAFPGAAGYLIEFTVAPARFSTANATAVEFPATTIPVRPGSFTTTAGTVDFPLAIPGGALRAGTLVNARVFATDAAGQILSGSQASDETQVAMR